MARDSAIEVEIKLAVAGVEIARKLLERKHYGVVKPRIFESNAIYDTPDYALRSRGELVRIRRTGDQGLLTFKAPDLPGKHKQREELETGVDDPAVLGAIFGRLGLQVSFRYEKYRTEYRHGDEPGTVTLDETPIGNFLELEGPADWIDATARSLGFSESDYILLSYGRLYLEYCRQRQIEPTNMLFDTR